MLHRVPGEENRRMWKDICRDDWESSRIVDRGQSSESVNPTIPHGRNEKKATPNSAQNGGFVDPNFINNKTPLNDRKEFLTSNNVKPQYTQE